MRSNVEFVTARGISYRNEIKTIKKKADVPLQPIYEAFMNSWEAILDRFSREKMHNGIISILFYRKSNIFSKDTEKVEYDKIFDEAELKKFIEDKKIKC